MVCEFPQCLQSCLLNWFYSKPQVLSIVKHEGGCLAGGVYSIVVCELSEGDYEGHAADKATMIDYSKTGANKR